MKSNGASLFSLSKDDKVVAVESSATLKGFWVIQSNGRFAHIDFSSVPVTIRGKAPEKLVAGVEYHCPVSAFDIEKIFVYPDGSLKTKPLKLRPCGLVYRAQNIDVEFVAFTSKARYVLIDVNQETVQLEPQETIVSVFAFNSN